MAASSSPRLQLETFEGPLDLLLHLIMTQALDIHQIPVSRITDQYLAHLHDSLAENMEIASEFIVMAATLLSLKARSLLPRRVLETPDAEDGSDCWTLEDESDLTRRLIEYQGFKEAAAELARREREREQSVGRMPMALDAYRHRLPVSEQLGAVSLERLLAALREAMKRTRPPDDVEVIRDRETIPERMRLIEQQVSDGQLSFFALLRRASRREIVTVFLAVLELIREGRVICIQSERFGDIWIRSREG